jgi:putative endonuclease
MGRAREIPRPAEVRRVFGMTQIWVGGNMREAKRFYVYIMTNRPRSHVLYTGVTGNLARRVFEHKNKLVPGFTSRYNLTRLAFYECFDYPDMAIDREKEIKGWRRSKKIRLIESVNPHWHDLAEHWTDVYKPDSGVTPREIPHSAEVRRVSG